MNSFQIPCMFHIWAIQERSPTHVLCFCTSVEISTNCKLQTVCGNSPSQVLLVLLFNLSPAWALHLQGVSSLSVLNILYSYSWMSGLCHLSWHPNKFLEGQPCLLLGIKMKHFFSSCFTITSFGIYLFICSFIHSWHIGPLVLDISQFVK